MRQNSGVMIAVEEKTNSNRLHGFRPVGFTCEESARHKLTRR